MTPRRPYIQPPVHCVIIDQINASCNERYISNAGCTKQPCSVVYRRTLYPGLVDCVKRRIKCGTWQPYDSIRFYSISKFSLGRSDILGRNLIKYKCMYYGHVVSIYEHEPGLILVVWVLTWGGGEFSRFVML